MAQAKSISLGQLTSAVQAAVKAAVQLHPKLKIPVPETITVDHLIIGFPVPDTVFANLTVAETQAFVNSVAAKVTEGGLGAEAKQLGSAGAFHSVGGHIICGIPPADSYTLKQ